MANTPAYSDLDPDRWRVSPGTYNRRTCQGPYLIFAVCKWWVDIHVKAKDQHMTTQVYFTTHSHTHAYTDGRLPC